jgi:hypothetical protein
MELEELLETLRRIEALHARTDVPGEREAAASALEVMRARLARLGVQDPPIEYKFTMADDWSRKLFTALLRRLRHPTLSVPRPTVHHRDGSSVKVVRGPDVMAGIRGTGQSAAEVSFRCDRSCDS